MCYNTFRQYERSDGTLFPQTTLKHIVTGIIAPVDSGKTTLTEALLYKAGELKKLGRVDNGDAFLDFEDTIKSSWEKTFSSQAPYGHAELSTLEEFALRTNSDVTLLVQKLTLAKLKGIDKTRSINDIAKDNGYSPAQLFEIIATTKIPMTSSSTMGGGSGGYGKLSLRDASEKYGFTMEQAMLFLREKGLDVQESTSLKEISDSLHVKPIELLDQLKTLSQNKETR